MWLFHEDAVHYNYTAYQTPGTSHTWPFDTVTQVVRNSVHNVQQEGEIGHVVHVNFIRLRGDGPQLVLVCILNT